MLCTYTNKSLSNHLLNLDPLFGLPFLFLPSHAEAQKKRDIQKRTARKICALSLNLEKLAAKPLEETESFPGGGGRGPRLVARQTPEEVSRTGRNNGNER